MSQPATTTGTAVTVSPVERFVGEVLAPERADSLFRGLPRHISKDRFERNLFNAIAGNPGLLAYDARLVFREISKAAALGLLLDPQLGEGYLIEAYNYKTKKKEPQLRVGYRGLMKLARQSGEITQLYAHEVRKNDQIICQLGDDKKLIHTPDLFGDRGEIVGYYAVVKYANGESDFEPMSLDQAHKIRDRSDGWKAFKDGKIQSTPWSTDEDEMAKKTVIRRLTKRIPQSPELADAIHIEDAAEAIIDAAPRRAIAPPPAPPAPAAQVTDQRRRAPAAPKTIEPEPTDQQPDPGAQQQPAPAQQDASAPQREVIEEADFSEESRVEGSASSDQPEHDPIDVEGELEALRDKLSHATSTVQAEQFYAEMDIEADLEGVEGAVKRARDILDETLERLTRAEQEKAAAAAPKPEEPEIDPFEIPLGFEDTRDFEVVIGAAVQSVTDKESGEKLKALWKGIGDQIRDAGISDVAVRHWQGLVIKKLKEHGVPVKAQPAAEQPKPVEEKQPETPAGIDLSVPAKTADEYRAHVEEHIRLAVTKADAEPLKKWYFSTSKLRDDLKIPESQRASLKDPLFERARVLRDMADGEALAG